MGEPDNLTALRRCGDQQAFSVTGDGAHRKVQSRILSVIKGKPCFKVLLTVDFKT